MSENPQNLADAAPGTAAPGTAVPGATAPAVGLIGDVEPEGGTTVVAAPPVRKRMRPGRVAAVAGSVVLAASVVAGVGFTVVTVRDADRDAGAPVWKLPKAEKAGRTAATGASGLAGMLVPYDDEWTRGPDIGEYGSDASLSGGEAAALRKESLSDLPRSERRQLARQIDKQDIQGMAMRSYLADEDAYRSEAPFTVSIELVRMDGGAARDTAAFQKDFIEILDVFRKGPKIEGHRNAHCFLPPKEADLKIDAMFCLAVQGDVLVTVDAYGVKSLDTKGVAQLVREQLDRIAEPGEAV
ncbi:hypothetical protein [Streptomyces europaeiscabiei]|uniref:hypothetical protein n=1 Tax=Streptomyces europaeiscabiei TaxID=146819 RepID=UPI0029A57CC5|nr:hypothetical protein [Streptomyces europaeiscabiei]MDX3584528.1 hypothetical protein [Streptomyces europaeiscabiei]